MYAETKETPYKESKIEDWAERQAKEMLLLVKSISNEDQLLGLIKGRILLYELEGRFNYANNIRMKTKIP